MPLPNVNITLANGALGGVIQTADGVAGAVLTGASAGSIVAGTPFLVTSLSDAATQGLVSATNPFAYRQVKEFYDEAGDGAQLYLMLVPSTMKVKDIADKTNAAGAIKLLNFAAGKIKVLGIMTDDTAVYPGGTGLTTTAGINDDVYTAAGDMQTLAEQFFDQETPFRAVIGGTSYTGTATALTDMTTHNYNRVAILIGDTASGSAAAIGLLLGRLAVIPVQRKISRVKTGALTNTTAYIGSTSADKYIDTSVLNDKAFITFRTFPNKSGFYFTGDPTCTNTTDDFDTIARGRVIDKAHILAYATYVEEVDNEVPVNTDGTLNAGYCKYLEQQIINQVNLTMTANNEVSGVDCFIDPTQNVLATNTVNVVLKITPVGYSSQINVTLGFSNPANG
ncbi:MAG: DUF2586 family protein [Flavipsychrobacter sp.]